MLEHEVPDLDMPEVDALLEFWRIVKDTFTMWSTAIADLNRYQHLFDQLPEPNMGWISSLRCRVRRRRRPHSSARCDRRNGSPYASMNSVLSSTATGWVGSSR